MELENLLGPELSFFTDMNELPDQDDLFLRAYEAYETENERVATASAFGFANTAEFAAATPIATPPLSLNDTNTPTPTSAAAEVRFASPVTDAELHSRMETAVPRKTKSDTQYCTNVWKEWSKYRNEVHGSRIPQLEKITLQELAR